MDKIIMPEELKAAVRALRAGNSSVRVGGLEAELRESNGSTYLVSGARKWKVEGTERLRLVEVKAAKAPPARGMVRSPGPARALKEAATDAQETCEACGTTFVKSRFNPYFTKCPDCRKKDRGPEPKARDFTCSKCGEAFTVSKFQPYLFSKPGDVPVCKKCSRKAAHKAYIQNKKSV
jgi:hypothetical protein